MSEFKGTKGNNNKEGKNFEISLWDFFTYGRDISNGFLSVRLINTLRRIYDINTMKQIILSEIDPLYILNYPRVGIKTVSEFEIKREAFINYFYPQLAKFDTKALGKEDYNG